LFILSVLVLVRRLLLLLLSLPLVAGDRLHIVMIRRSSSGSGSSGPSR
jgi:hypothetical protein